MYASSAALLGGDAVISSMNPIKPKIKNLVADFNLNSSDTLNFFSVISTEQNMVITTIKAIESNYPLAGKIVTNTNLKIPAPGTVWLDENAMLRLNIKLGDQVTIGDRQLQVGAKIISAPDLTAAAFGLTSRAIMLQEDLAATHVLSPGSRINYKLYVSGTKQQMANFAAQLTKILPPGTYYQDLQTQDKFSSNALNQTEKYLSLSTLVNLLLAAAVISIAINLFAQRHTSDVAIMRCLGTSVKQLQRTFWYGLFILALVLGLIGSSLGFIIQQSVALILKSKMQIDLPMPGLEPAILGVASSLLLVIGFGAPKLLQLSKILPMQILRQNINASDNNKIRKFYILTILAFVGLLYWQTVDYKLLLSLAVGVLCIAVIALFLISVWYKLSIFCKDKAPAIVRLSMLNIVANAKHNAMQVLAFALIICVALLLYIIRVDLLNTWQGKIPADAPNYFVTNIFPEDVEHIKQYLQQHNIAEPIFYPIVRGVLSKINQEFVSMGAEEPNKRPGFNRPLNITWTANIPKDNKILAGAWFTADANGKPEISLEQGMAKRLGIELFDDVTFVISTQEITTKVTSIRSVQWDSFNPNFYVIAAPGLLENFAVTYMTSFFVPITQAKFAINFVHKFPQCALTSVKDMLQQASSILTMVTLIISYIWFFTMLVGFFLLFAVIWASINTRLQQNNLLRILGARKHQLMAVLSIEFALLGGAAGLFGTIVAMIVANYLANYVLQISYAPSLCLYILGILIGCAGMLAGGILATNRVFKATPIQLSQNLD